MIAERLAELERLLRGCVLKVGASGARIRGRPRAAAEHPQPPVAFPSAGAPTGPRRPSRHVDFLHLLVGRKK
jgi:hypothetical protein